MKTERFDISIIGGGPAGAACAIYLSGLGFDVCLVEKKKFPREVICGEFLSGEVFRNLNEMSLTDEFYRLNPNPIKSVRFIFDDERESASPLNFPAYSLKRSTFDNFLINAAENKGVNIFQPAEVKEIIESSNIYILKIKREGEEELQISSRILAAAYGKQNILDKSLGRKFAGTKSNFYGVKFHLDKSNFKYFEDSEIRMHSSPGVYCGLNAVDGNTVNVCFLRYIKNNFQPSRDFLSGYIAGSRSLNKMFHPGYDKIIKSLPLWGTGNIYFGKKRPVEKGIFMVGDAAGMIAPLTGDGIGMAFQSAKLFAEITAYLHHGKITRNKAEELYTSKWNSLFRRRILVSSIIQKMLMNDSYRIAAKYLLSLHAGILPGLIKITRG